MAMAITASHISTFSCAPPATSSYQRRRDQEQQRSSSPGSPGSPGIVRAAGHGECGSILRVSFTRDVSHFSAAVRNVSQRAITRPVVVTARSKAVMQFIRGINELTVPDVSLTRSRDGTNGVANFVFDQPSVFDSSRELGDITGLYMIDEEGTLSSVDVSAKFVNGKPSKIEARYIMRNVRDWDRFMRFMERYATENELGFVKK